MRKIRTRIMMIVLAAVLICAGALCGFSALAISYSTNSTAEKILLQTAELAAHDAENVIKSYTYVVGEIATNQILTNPEISAEEKQKFIDEKVAQYYMQGGGLLDTTGTNNLTGVSYAGQDFFKSALEGKTYFSTPYVSEDQQTASIMVSAPVKQGDTVTGVLYFACDNTVLQDIVNGISIGEEGDGYILDKTGTTIAYADQSLVLTKSNAIQESAASPNDQPLADLAAVEKRMVQGETGIGRYQYGDIQSLQGFTTIPGTDGWSIGVTVSEGEMMIAANISSLLMLGIGVAICVIGALAALRIGKSISTPIEQCTQRLAMLAQGDIHSPVPEVKRKDELGVLADSLRNATEKFDLYIGEISYALSEFANNNYDLRQPKEHFLGDFASIEESVMKLMKEMSATMQQIEESAKLVSMNADQLSTGAQMLAQGATEQSSSVEELSSTIASINQQVSENAKAAGQANELVDQAEVFVTNSNDKMNSLMQAMEHINEKSGQIGKIIQTIEDIAFQTNILALNASVEAARAGSAGSGFAVVADEVRVLAAKSAEAAKNTAALIDESVQAINKGVTLTDDAANELQMVVQSTGEVSKLVKQIAIASNMQADSIAQVETGVAQISDVVHSSSANSEESAASSEELSGQADLLKHLIDKFKIKR